MLCNGKGERFVIIKLIIFVIALLAAILVIIDLKGEHK